LPAPVVWHARDVASVIALRRETVGAVVSRTAILRTFPATIVARAIAATDVPVPMVSEACTHRLAQLFTAWTTHFALTHTTSADDAARAASDALARVATHTATMPRAA
jgi:hypothetical protein